MVTDIDWKALEQQSHRIMYQHGLIEIFLGA